jgi:hypothetical protein
LAAALGLGACATGSSRPADDDDLVDADPLAPDGGQAPDAFVDALHGWQPLGSGIDARPGQAAYSPAVAILDDGQPVVAFVEAGGDGASIFVYRWTGSAWLPLGDAINDGLASATATEPSLAVGPDDSVYLAYAEYTAAGGGTAYHLQRWTGSAWMPLPGTPLQETDLLTAYNDLVAARDGSLWFAATRKVDDHSAFHVWHYATSWQDLGGDEDVAVDAYLPFLAEAQDGTIYLSWEGSPGIKIRRFDATTGTWVHEGTDTLPLPEAPFSTPNSPALGVTAAGHAVMGFHCYKDNIDGVDSFLSVFDGASWQLWDQGLQAYAGQYMGQPTYAQMQDVVGLPGSETVALAWTEEDATGEQAVYVDRCTQAGCSPLGRQRLSALPGIGTPGGSARLAADSHGRVVAVWSETDGSENRIYAWRYHGDPDL